MKKFTKYIIFTLLLFCFSFKAKATDYKIDGSLDTEQRTLYANCEISLKNTLNDETNFVYLLLGINRSYDSNLEIIEITDNNGTILVGEYYNHKYLGNLKEDKSIYKVYFPKSLSKESNLTLKIKFKNSNLSKVNNILFLEDSINDYYKGSWYPRLVESKSGWNPDNFSINNYDINLIIESSEKVISSGQVLSETKIRQSRQKKVYLKANKIRNFSLAISKKLFFNKKKIKLKSSIEKKLEIKSQSKPKKTTSNVNINSYYFTNENNNKYVLELAEEIIQFYKNKLGFYPYKSLNIINKSSYSNKVVSTNSSFIILDNIFSHYKNKKEAEKVLEWHLSYAIAQQYFGYYISEVGDYPKWINSGSSLYLTYLYSKVKNNKNTELSNLTNLYIRATKAGFNTKINQKIDYLRFSNFDWKNIIEKGKAFTIFRMLEYTVGRKNLIESLKFILNKHSHSFINQEVFQRTLIEKSKKDLNFFFEQWVKQNKFIDYSVDKIVQRRYGKKYKIKISIKRIGTAIIRVPIAVSLKNGEKIFRVIDGDKKETNISIEYHSPAKEVTIDPAKILPDINLKNNSSLAPHVY